MKFRIWRVKNIVYMQFTDTSNLPFVRGSGDVFESSSGICIKSVSSPQFDLHRRDVFLPGTSTYHDHIIETHKFISDQKAQGYLDSVIEAFEEYKDSLK